MDVTKVARQFTLAALMRMVGLPLSDFDQIAHWSDLMGHMLDPVRGMDPVYREPANQALSELIDYLQTLMEIRRADPLDDVLSSFAAPNERGQSLDVRDAMGLITRSMINAGHSTTTNQIGNNVIALAQHPDQVEILRSKPELMSAAIEELFRFEGTGQVTVRVAADGTEICGTPIPEGQIMWAFEASANRDPSVFESPDTLDFARDTSRSLASGGVVHYCLGVSLSRLETEVALDRMINRVTDIAILDEVHDLPRDGNIIIRGAKELLIPWCKRTAHPVVQKNCSSRSPRARSNASVDPKRRRARLET